MLVLATALSSLLATGHHFQDTTYGPIAGILFFATASGAVAVLASHADKRLTAILLVAFVLRFGVALADDTLGLFPKADQNGYDYEATHEAAAWADGEPGRIAWGTSVGAYVHTLGAVYFLFGPEMLLARAFSAFEGVLAALLIFAVAQRVVETRTARATAGLYAVWPSIVYLQSETLRDPTIHVLILAALQGAIVLNQKGTPVWKTVVGAAAVGVGLAAMWFFRPATALVMLLPLAMLIAWRGRSLGTISRRSKLLLGGAVLMAMWTLGANYAHLLQNLDGLVDYRDQWATGGSAYLRNRSFDNLFSLMLFLPLGAIHFLFTPFPWHVHNGLSILAFAENLLFLWPLAILAIPQMARRARHVPSFALIAFLVVAAVLFGIVEGNVGTALRHRAQFNWIFIIFAAPAVVRLWDAHGHKIPIVRRFVAPTPQAAHSVETPSAVHATQDS